MCDPVTLLTMGVSAAGNLAGIAGGRQAAQSGAEYGKAASDIDAAVADFNADLMHRQAGVQRAGADLPLAAGALAERRLRDKVDATLGTGVARAAAAGVDPGAGAPLLAQQYSAGQGELDAGIIRARSQRERANILASAASTDVAGTNAEWQGIGARLKGQQALATGRLGAASSLISGVSKWPGLIGKGAGAFGGGSEAFLPSTSFLKGEWGY